MPRHPYHYGLWLASGAAVVATAGASLYLYAWSRPHHAASADTAQQQGPCSSLQQLLGSPDTSTLKAEPPQDGNSREAEAAAAAGQRAGSPSTSPTPPATPASTRHTPRTNEHHAVAQSPPAQQQQQELASGGTANTSSSSSGGGEPVLLQLPRACESDAAAATSKDTVGVVAAAAGSSAVDHAPASHVAGTSQLVSSVNDDGEAATQAARQSVNIDQQQQQQQQSSTQVLAGQQGVQGEAAAQPAQDIEQQHSRCVRETAAADSAARQQQQPLPVTAGASQQQPHQQQEQPLAEPQQQPEQKQQQQQQQQLPPVLRRVSQSLDAGDTTTSSSSGSTPWGVLLSPTAAAAAGAGAAVRHHRSFNTARQAPSLDDTVASAAVARSLEVQYQLSTASEAAPAQDAGPVQDAVARSSSGSRITRKGSARLHGGTDGSSGSQQQQQPPEQAVSSLAAGCAALCVQHCTRLQDTASSESTVLDIGCGTGGCCFQLAASFSHVLGIDGDLLNITAAKELRAHGELCFRPVTPAAAAGTATGSGVKQQGGASAPGEQEEQAVRVVRVPEHIDRDRVRFWHCPLPQLPPKLQPVDAVLVEDVDGHLGPGLGRVCQQLPELLKPGGVCVVVLGAAAGVNRKAAECSDPDSINGSAASLQDVKAWLVEAGLWFEEDVELRYESGTQAVPLAAHAGVWRQRE